MPREIKFRAWDKEQEKMWSAEEMGQDQLTLSPDGRGFINVSGQSTKLSQYLSHLIPLQYTGLKDKNGVEIFEGDIVTDMGAAGNSPFNFTVGSMRWHYPSFQKQCEVIGNIYEDDNLLTNQLTNN